MTSGLEFDLSSITEGLKAKVYFSFDMYNQYIEDILNSYAVYNPVYDAGTIESWNKYKTDVKGCLTGLSPMHITIAGSGFLVPLIITGLSVTMKLMLLPWHTVISTLLKLSCNRPNTSISESVQTICSGKNILQN